MEIHELDVQPQSLVTTAAPALLKLPGVGIDTAAALLVAGDNPDRLASETSFAALSGATPVDASSGRQKRHRLNRGGNRDANRALWVVATVRMSRDPRTRDYVRRRTAEGLTKKEIIRCLNRYIAREIYRALLAVIPEAQAGVGRGRLLTAGLLLVALASSLWPGASPAAPLAQACSPRPIVGAGTAFDPPGCLLVAIAANSHANTATNQLVRLDYQTVTNSQTFIDLFAQQVPFSANLPPGVTTAQFG